jgi:hypothetical protein
MGMTLDATSGGDCRLVSYDVSGSARSVAARVCQIIFGRKRTLDGQGREERGFIHRAGVVRIGQSVLARSRGMRMNWLRGYGASVFG